MGLVDLIEEKLAKSPRLKLPNQMLCYHFFSSHTHTKKRYFLFVNWLPCVLIITLHFFNECVLFFRRIKCFVYKYHFAKKNKILEVELFEETSGNVYGK